MKTLLSICCSALVFAGFSQTPTNIIIFEKGEKSSFAPCEPSIAVNPSNPSEMVAGAVLNYVATSPDSGKTWETDYMKSRYGVYGDPCIVADEKGRFYYFHLSDPSGKGWNDPSILDRIVCQRSNGIGKKWNKGFAPSPNGTKDQDKEWVAVHPTLGYLVMTWTEFDTYGAADDSCKSRILMAISENGKKWSRPYTISQTEGNCIDDSKTVEGATPAFSVDGDIYVSWSMNGDIKFVAIDMQDWKNKAEQKPRIGPEQTIVNGGANWTFEIPGLGRANGMPITLYDLSSGPNKGTIYINWADQRNGENDTDIWMISSKDKGKTWTEKVRVNDDKAGSQQFFTWATIDQSNGNIYAVFYDRRNHSDNSTDVYLATSKDGGKSFENQQISEDSFTVPEGIFFGDYNNISAVNGVIRPIWTSVKNGKLVVMTALINEK
ncbi:MAG: glycoside hydrolase [Salibacteraceae bacterium]|nr:glycoside hydrolase [Salibacteraceae bacterium]